jgi:ABC-type multidrug transport system fused ATPase/permease subunit
MFSIFQKLMFSYVRPLIEQGKTRFLQPEDMPPLLAELEADSRLISEAKESSGNISSAAKLIGYVYRPVRKKLWLPLSLNLSFVFLGLMKPLLLHSFLVSLGALSGAGNAALAHSLALACALGFISFVGSLCLQHYFYRTLRIVQTLTSRVNVLVFEQSLRLSPRAMAESPLGDSVNHMSSDSDAISDSPLLAGDLIISIFTILGCVGLLFYFLGLTAFLALGLLLLLGPLTRKVAKAFTHFDERLMEFRDQRVTLMGQVLNGIRIVKYFAWEKSMAKEVQELRGKELGARKRLARAEALATLSYVGISTIVLFSTLFLHSWRGFLLTPELIFTSVSIFALLEEPFAHLSSLVSRAAGVKVAADRLCKFLARERLAEAKPRDAGSIGIQLEEVSFQHKGAENFALRNLELTLRPGESLALVGRVGCGKSTLLQLLLGELSAQEGRIRFFDSSGKRKHPSFGYVPQEAFVFNGSLRENIMFGLPEDRDRLLKSAYASCLDSDLSELPAGWETELGEKGVNLSGGQKQRLSLARCFYHEPNFILLDDPLSAIDPRTEEQVLDRLVFGAWANATRIVATHRLSCLPRFHRIAYLEEGRIVAMGSLPELISGCPEFRSFYSASENAEGNRSLGEKEGERLMLQMPTKEDRNLRFTDDEDRAVGAVQANVYGQYLKALGGQRLAFQPLVWALLLGLAASVSLLPLLQKAWLAHFSNVQGGKTLPMVPWASEAMGGILVYGALGIFTLVVVLANRLFWLDRGMAAGKNLHDQMLKAVLHSPLRFFDATPMGRILQRFSRDVEAVDVQLQWSFETTVRCLVNIATALFLIVGVMPLVLVFLVPVMALYYSVQRDYRIPAREAKRLDSIARSPRFAHFKETLQGLAVIRSFGQEQTFWLGFFQRLNHSHRMFQGHYLLNRWFSSRVPLLGAMIASVTGIGIVFYTKLNLVSVGTAGLVMVYALTLWESLNWAIRIFSEMESKMTSVERLRYFGTLPSERAALLPVASEEDLRKWPSKGEIVFEEVKARYSPHLPPVLKGLSFRVPAGAKVGLIGRTGSGKSTVIQTLFRCMELESGRILIDGINTAAIPLALLRSRIAIIPQDPVLFQGSLRSNLDRFQEHSDEALWQALEQAQLGEHVRNLPGGLLAQVKESGSNFSQGQRQLFCLARALLIRSKIIVMDEATASVDVETDRIVQRVIARECAGVTVLVIAHRLGTVGDSDLVLELREGRLTRTIDLRRHSEGHHEPQTDEAIN